MPARVASSVWDRPAQVADAGAGGFEDPQARQPGHGCQREVMPIPGLTRSGHHGPELQVSESGRGRPRRH